MTESIKILLRIPHQNDLIIHISTSYQNHKICIPEPSLFSGLFQFASISFSVIPVHMDLILSVFLFQKEIHL